MSYPTIEQIRGAGMDQLRGWFHDLPDPKDTRQLMILELIMRKYFCISSRRAKRRSATIQTPNE